MDLRRLLRLRTETRADLREPSARTCDVGRMRHATLPTKGRSDRQLRRPWVQLWRTDANAYERLRTTYQRCSFRVAPEGDRFAATEQMDSFKLCGPARSLERRFAMSRRGLATRVIFSNLSIVPVLPTSDPWRPGSSTGRLPGQPPSREMRSPVRYDEASLARNSAVPTISSAEAIRSRAI
jgi:hypothetical protein